MPLVYAAVVPHAPILIPSIAKEHARSVAQTTNAITTLAAEAYAAKPDVLVVLSPHGPALPGAFSVEVQESMTGTLEEFGDVSTEVKARGAIGQAHQLKTAAEAHRVPLVLQTYPSIDYGATVPLSFFSELLKQTRLLILQTGTLPLDEQLRCGTALHDFFQQSQARYALIASADLSRQESKRGARRPTPEERQLSSAIKSVNVAELGEVRTDSATCGIGPIVLILSVLKHLQATGEILSFEAPFSVGLLVANFHFGQ